MSNLLGGSALCIVGAVLVVGFIFLANAIRIVPEYQRLVVFRLGRSVAPRVLVLYSLSRSLTGL